MDISTTNKVVEIMEAAYHNLKFRSKIGSIPVVARD